MKIKNNGTGSLTFRRFDTNENITLSSDEEIILDKETAQFLLKINSTYVQDGIQKTLTFIEV